MGIQVRDYENATPGFGACIYVEAGGRKLLLDCGLKKVADQPIQFPFDPKTIDAVVISHGHLGHCGLLPILCKQGFTGQIYGTPQTKRLALLGMTEAAFIYQERKGDSPADVFYTTQDVQHCGSLFQPLVYHIPTSPFEGLTLTSYNAGHVAGSSIVKLVDSSQAQPSSLLYMADVGLLNNDMKHPDVLNECYEALIVSVLEKTRDSWKINRKNIAAIINEACRKSGNILFSVFSADQRQKLLITLYQLTSSGQIPPLFAFLDTPTAEESKVYLSGKQPMVKNNKLLKLVGPQETSEFLDTISGTVIIISGMRHQDSGRMTEHFMKNLPNPNSAVVFIGNQLEGTINRQIQQGDKVVKINGCDCHVAAAIHTFYDPELHLNQPAFMTWLKKLKSFPRMIKLTH